MNIIDASGVEARELNNMIRQSDEKISVKNCLGQRFIAAGLSEKKIDLDGTPGNALGAYLNGAEICVHGNAQDAVGDTMNDGKIVIYGNIGDAAGYAMRGGEIFVKGNAGYRAGIHMKEYGEKRPVIVIGGTCGSFLGEYQAGGIIILLGLNSEKEIVSNFPCTGMHGGKVFLASDCKNIVFPKNVSTRYANAADIADIEEYLSEFSDIFGYKKEEIINRLFTVVEPDSKNPYKQMYVAN